MYGEWLREQFDKGAIPEPTYDPDLAILLSQLRENSINLFGPEATVTGNQEYIKIGNEATSKIATIVHQKR